jgi:hypothetical protein
MNFYIKSRSLDVKCRKPDLTSSAMTNLKLRPLPQICYNQTNIMAVIIYLSMPVTRISVQSDDVHGITAIIQISPTLLIYRVREGSVQPGALHEGRAQSPKRSRDRDNDGIAVKLAAMVGIMTMAVYEALKMQTVDSGRICRQMRAREHSALTSNRRSHHETSAVNFFIYYYQYLHCANVSGLRRSFLGVCSTVPSQKLANFVLENVFSICDTKVLRQFAIYCYHSNCVIKV